MVSRKKRLWALSVAALVVGPAAAQVKFAQMTAPEYLTYCASAASGQILTPGCSNSYQQLTDVVQAVLSNPKAFGDHHLGQLNALCAPTPDSGPSCVTQLQNMADAYVEGLPQPSPQVARKDTCEGTLAPNAKPFFDTFMPFTCLSDGHGGSCLVQVAQALQEAGVLDQLVPVLTGQSTFAKMLSGAAGNVTTLCHIMNTAGCCAQSFFDITNSLLTMTCHALTAQTLGDMVTQCPSPLPAACPKTQVPNFEPPTGCPIASGITIPAAADDCGIPPGMCPQNACQWICAVVTDDPPALVPGTLPSVPVTSPGSADASLESCAAEAVASDEMVECHSQVTSSPTAEHVQPGWSALMRS